MSLKCSVFGHRFGDPDVQRDREEQGSEVVITITETETCERCGETRVVSENKEVTTLETPSDIVGDDLDDSGTETGPAEGTTADEGTATPGSASASESASASGSGDQSEGAETVESGPDETGAEGVTTGQGDAAGTAEDAEPIEEAEPSAARSSVEGAGETPESGHHAGGTSETAPDRGVGTDANADADTDDAVILDANDDAEDDEERAPGEWPQDEDGTDEGWTPPTDDGELRPIEEEQPTVEPTDEALSVPEGEFHCPECGFTTAVESSSLREGDFCPECHTGTLTHRSGE